MRVHNREKKPKIIKKSFFNHVNSCYAECRMPQKPHLGQSIQEWTNKICGRQPLKNLKRFELNTLSHLYPHMI